MLRISFEVTMPKALWALAVVVCLAAPVSLRTSTQNSRMPPGPGIRPKFGSCSKRAQIPTQKIRTGGHPDGSGAGGYTDTVRVLLENGADVNATDLVG